MVVVKNYPKWWEIWLAIHLRVDLLNYLVQLHNRGNFYASGTMHSGGAKYQIITIVQTIHLFVDPVTYVNTLTVQYKQH